MLPFREILREFILGLPYMATGCNHYSSKAKLSMHIFSRTISAGYKKVSVHIWAVSSNFHLFFYFLWHVNNTCNYNSYPFLNVHVFSVLCLLTSAASVSMHLALLSPGNCLTLGVAKNLLWPIALRVIKYLFYSVCIPNV